MLLLATLPIFSLSYHAVNVDKVTAAAMTAAYASEAEMEAMNTSNLQKIVDHYKSATVATAGILLSKKKDRDAMRNPGLFASEENYYYKRILNLVKNGIMPKLITVASKMVKQPQNAIYWGPYLFKTTENVEQLCKQFELVCTNGKLSFKDVTFLLYSCLFLHCRHTCIFPSCKCILGDGSSGCPAHYIEYLVLQEVEDGFSVLHHFLQDDKL